MDRNVDSIGSCSLDVDAESTDISDTSGSLNFPTPISIKDITREFTKNIKERCSVPTQTFVDSITGQVCTAVTHSSAITSSISVDNAVRNTAYPTVAVDTTGTATTSVLLSPRTPESFVSEKKPSYLNLGCCVNSYSNITTYDSKIRQDINKSREVSPIRPSTSALQYCKKSNSLALPIMLTMPKKNDAKTSPSRPTVVLDNDSSLEIGTDTRKQYHNNTNVSKLRSIPIVEDRTQKLEKGNSYNKLSFIKQQVGRLCGLGTLVQDWCIRRKKDTIVQYENSGDDSTTSQALTTKSSAGTLYATTTSSKNSEESSSWITILSSFDDSITGQVCTAVTHSSAITSSISVDNAVRNTAYPTVAVDTTGTATTSVLLSPRTPESFVSEKKPSYLNLGCCVNSYSNITTYDSKIRQDINKSREVSPIRPSTSALQYCKKSNSLALPIMLTMPKKNDAKTSPSRPTVVLDNDSSLEIGTDTRKQYHNNTNVSKLRSIPIVEDRTQKLEKGNSYNKLSFIKQQVGRLCGLGTLVQDWCIRRKKDTIVQYENSGDDSTTSQALTTKSSAGTLYATTTSSKNSEESSSWITILSSFDDSITGQVCTAVTHSSAITSSISVDNAVRNTAYPTVAVDTTGTATTSVLLSPRTPESFVSEKKPSYLNLGCCVNSYSNITTYDSKIRQDINKSREVSPIRPSTSALQYCKKSNSLALPIMLTMPKKNDAKTSPSRPTVVLDNDSSLEIGTDTRKQYHNNTNVSKLRSIPIVEDRTQKLEKGNSYNKLSFIKQQVGRLCGLGTVVQDWCIRRKKDTIVQYENSGDDSTTSQALTTKSSVGALYATAGSSKNSEESSSWITILSSFDDDSDNSFSVVINEFTDNHNGRNSDHGDLDSDEVNYTVDLPCLRYLSQEFRAQLPSISPKKRTNKNSHSQESQNQLSKTSLNNGGDYDKDTVLPKNTCNNYNLNLANSGNSVTIEVINGNVDNDELKTSSSITSAEECNDILISDKSDFTSSKISLANNNQVEKDGHYFWQQLKIQQERLLKLADNCDSYLSFLMEESNGNEDVLGLLRSASGKARLLVSQKLNQFEGLCHSNLNNQPGDKFHTTADDLQGFWDMVYLQIDQLDAIFRDIEELKKNGWKSPEEQSSRFTPKNSENIVRNTSTNATENNFD